MQPQISDSIGATCQTCHGQLPSASHTGRPRKYCSWQCRNNRLPCPCGTGWRRTDDARCLECARALRRARRRGPYKLSSRSCVICGDSFQPKSIDWPSTCRRDECRIERLRRIRDARKNPNKSQALRASRLAYSRQRRARGWRPAKGRWIRICRRDRWRCWICRQVIDKSLLPPHRESGSCDHVVPLVHGGSDDDANLKAAHLSCNSRRGAKFVPSSETTHRVAATAHRG